MDACTLSRAIGSVLLGAATFGAAERGSSQPVVVCLVKGAVLVELPGAVRPRPAALLDRLPAGTAVECRRDAVVALVTEDGRRFQVVGEARIEIGDGEVHAVRGSLERLPAVPSSISLAPILEAGGLNLRAGAVRVRGDEGGAAWLYPREGAAARASGTTLRFAAVAGAREYAVAIEDEGGERVLAVQTAATTVEVPAGILRPSASYFWRFRPLGDSHLYPSTEAYFVTLSDADAASFSELERRSRAGAEPSMTALRIGLAAGLGLWWEACEALQESAGALPSHDLTELGQRLSCQLLTAAPPASP